MYLVGHWKRGVAVFSTLFPTCDLMNRTSFTLNWFLHTSAAVGGWNLKESLAQNATDLINVIAWIFVSKYANIYSIDKLTIDKLYDRLKNAKRINVNVEMCHLWRRWVYHEREKGREGFYQTDYNIIRNRKKRTVPGRNPISDLISEILNARDASSFDRSARTNTSQMERKVEKYRKGRSRSDSVGSRRAGLSWSKIFLRRLTSSPHRSTVLWQLWRLSISRYRLNPEDRRRDETGR